LNFKTSHTVLQTGVVAGALAAVFAANVGLQILSMLGLLLMAGSLIQAYFFYQCPYCHRRFNIRCKPPKHCPECGKELE